MGIAHEIRDLPNLLLLTFLRWTNTYKNRDNHAQRPPLDVADARECQRVLEAKTSLTRMSHVALKQMSSICCGGMAMPIWRGCSSTFFSILPETILDVFPWESRKADSAICFPEKRWIAKKDLQGKATRQFVGGHFWRRRLLISESKLQKNPQTEGGTSGIAWAGPSTDRTLSVWEHWAYIQSGLRHPKPN